MNSESLNLGPLDSLLKDPEVSEIMVNSYAQIFAEKAGRILSTNLKFIDERSLQEMLNNLATACDRSFSPEHPYFDAQLPDGSRINAVMPPMSPKGSVLTIRKFRRQLHDITSLIEQGTLDEKCAFFLDAAVKARFNIVVSGGTSTGKTTLLNALSSLIPPEERIISIEDVAELQLQHPNWVRLESTKTSTTKISTRDCLSNALRMRPDRIIVGECRREETFDMLQAMNTGHEGSMTTVHANSTRDCLGRLESLVASCGWELPIFAVRSHMVSAIDLIVQLKRSGDGRRVIQEVLELTGIEGETITSQPVFTREKNKEGKLLTTGLVPASIQKMTDAGIKLPTNFFSPGTKVTFFPEPPTHPND